MIAICKLQGAQHAPFLRPPLAVKQYGEVPKNGIDGPLNKAFFAKDQETFWGSDHMAHGAMNATAMINILSLHEQFQSQKAYDARKFTTESTCL